FIQGPAAVRVDSSSAATVLHGKVVFRADDTAAPFDLFTPSSRLVDLGTEYAVFVGPDGEGEVHVFEGEVQRTPRVARDEIEPEYLTAGEARRYEKGTELVGRPPQLDRKLFVRQVPATGRHRSDPAAGLLTYEGFSYTDPDALGLGRANGGTGWDGPWQ